MKCETLQEEIRTDFTAFMMKFLSTMTMSMGLMISRVTVTCHWKPLLGKRETLAVPFSILAAELEGYINMPCIPCNESPFLSWKQHKTTFLHIAKLA